MTQKCIKWVIINDNWKIIKSTSMGSPRTWPRGKNATCPCLERCAKIKDGAIGNQGMRFKLIFQWKEALIQAINGWDKMKKFVAGNDAENKE